MEGFSNFHIKKNYSLTLRWVDVFYSASNHIRLRWVYVMRRGPLPSSLWNLWKIMAANTSRMTKEEEGHVVRIPRSVVVEIWKIFESHILSTLDLINPEKAFHSIQNLPTSPATRVNWWWWWEWKMCVNEIEIVAVAWWRWWGVGVRARAISHIISSETTYGVKECAMYTQTPRMSGRDEKEIQFFKMTHNYSL